MNKIIHRFQLIVIYSVVFLLTACVAGAQNPGKPVNDTVLNKYGLWVIHSTDILNKTAINNAAKQMIDIKKHIPSILLDLRYAGTNNFMHVQLYPALNTTFLRKAAADSLLKIQQLLKKKGLGIKIFDAYRPYAVTERMWEPVKDDRYAADPKKGSGHNRGIAVDLTLVDLKTKKELPMGTGFDNFTDSAHHAFTDLPKEILQNRLLLKKIMEEHGFKALDTEWWHYYLPNAANFELLDIDFKELEQNNKNIHK
ncbi:M15 family metallopeptidase [Ferruginibacter sp.]